MSNPSKNAHHDFGGLGGGGVQFSKRLDFGGSILKLHRF